MVRSLFFLMQPISHQDAGRPLHDRRRNAVVPRGDRPLQSSAPNITLISSQTPSATATMRQALLFEQKVEEMKPSKRYPSPPSSTVSMRSLHDAFKNNWESLLEFRAEKIN